MSEHEDSPAFSRSVERTEKRTIATPVSIRFTSTELNELQSQADYYGMERCDYIRHLLAKDKLVLKDKWDSLVPLFSSSKNISMNTVTDSVGHES